jgi:PIN domain nuclease of toxin-antitoxin system
MNLLLDTHFVIELVDTKLGGFSLNERYLTLADVENAHVSVVSLWEVAIKVRIGKLPLRVKVEIWPQMLAEANIPLLPISSHHVLAPVTNDPFDRLLLGVCAAEGMKLLTIDRALVAHPLAWR